MLSTASWGGNFPHSAHLPQDGTIIEVRPETLEKPCLDWNPE